MSDEEEVYTDEEVAEEEEVEEEEEEEEAEEEEHVASRHTLRHVEHTDHAEPEEALTEAEQVMLVSQLYRTRKKGHQKC
ncbi:unnamed protein product [Heligmosomoides polygyrus]|uniref:Uncharacterized protein n=1 Tax=Heligmosomoides polygyrus TaxID=6339 RepID=A0A183F8H3_HELPZ|nr:unnamed protein product [Heligmosomoides polygyrus]